MTVKEGVTETDVVLMLEAELLSVALGEGDTDPVGDEDALPVTDRLIVLDGLNDPVSDTVPVADLVFDNEMETVELVESVLLLVGSSVVDAEAE